MQSTAIPIIQGRTVYLAHLIAMLIAVAAHGQCQYEVTAIIQAPPCQFGDRPPLVGRGMNELGHVVGSFHDCNFSAHDHGFFWTLETGVVVMHKPDNVWRVNATDINDHGMIVGSMSITGVGSRGFVYDMHRQDYLMLLEPLQGAGDTTINAINNAGIAVGSRSIGKPGVHPIPYNAVIWNTHTGDITDLGVGDGPNSGLNDISENGNHVVGWTGSTPTPTLSQAVIWTNGKPEIIGPVPGTDYSTINAVNISGIGVGSGRTQGDVVWRAFIWDGSLTIIDATENWQNAHGEAINDLGQAFIRFSNPAPHMAMLWQHGELHHLNALLVDGSPDVHLTGVTATNNHGQVLCTASTRSVLLTPADRPLTDLNADCRTDVHDLLMLLDAWGPLPRAKQNTGSPADLNGDGVVNVSDLLILLANWDY